jgi:hypothetical protein
MFTPKLFNNQFNPKLYGTLRLWLDAMNPAGNGTRPSDGTAVSSWTDLSGNGNTVVQATGANQPIFKVNIINGKPVIRFNGTNNFLQKTSATAMSSTNTLFVVGTINANATNRGTFFDYSTTVATNTGVNFLVESGGGIHYITGFYDGTLDQANSATITLPKTNVFHIYNDGANGFLYGKQTSLASVATGNTNNTGTRAYTLGSLFGSVANYFLNGDIAEILFYSGQLSNANATAVLGSLAGKWGL